jgi:type VI secretion system protein ImpM
MVKPAPRRVCWWGKLPARGDFVGRGLPPRWRAEWDGWLQRGLALAAATVDAGTLRERLASFAPWRYVALTSAGETWCGIIVASHDRAGRRFPLTLVERLAAPVSPVECSARLASLLGPAAEGPDALEGAIAALPARDMPSMSLQSCGSTAVWPTAPASVWWPLAAADDAAPCVAAWPPEPAFLLGVLGIEIATGKRIP